MHSGTSGVVYAARNKRTGQCYAVKTIRKDDWRAERAIRSEISIMRELYHPHIVNLHETFETPAEMHLVLDLVDGVELFDKVIELRTYSEHDARVLIRTVLQTLAYLHSLSIAHRDLKPENLLLMGASSSSLTNVKLSDFGMASHVRPGETLFHQCGSAGYIAPEIIAGKGYNTQVDLWSLGCIAYILLSGYPPFQPLAFPAPEWTRVSSDAIDFVAGLLQSDPARRMNARDALQHRWLNVGPLQHKHNLAATQKSLKQYNEFTQQQQQQQQPSPPLKEITPQQKQQQPSPSRN
jgi:serine/threonine protein kinase